MNTLKLCVKVVFQLISTNFRGLLFVGHNGHSTLPLIVRHRVGIKVGLYILLEMCLYILCGCVLPLDTHTID